MAARWKEEKGKFEGERKSNKMAAFLSNVERRVE
jgi:hypothetical protein